MQKCWKKTLVLQKSTLNLQNESRFMSYALYSLGVLPVWALKMQKKVF